MIQLVVLGKLVYYGGTIFLTTNLLGNIDDASQSCAQIHLCYSSLLATLRTQICESHLAHRRNAPVQSPNNDLASPGSEAIDRTTDIELSLDDYDALLEWNLNGREVKNMIKNARAWCSSKQQSLTYARWEAFVQVAASFAERKTMAMSDSAVVRNAVDGKVQRLSTK